MMFIQPRFFALTPFTKRVDYPDSDGVQARIVMGEHDPENKEVPIQFNTLIEKEPIGDTTVDLKKLTEEDGAPADGAYWLFNIAKQVYKTGMNTIEIFEKPVPKGLNS